MQIKSLLISALLLLGAAGLYAQGRGEQQPAAAGPKAETFRGLKFRSIGPAFLSGRIADIALHPHNNSVWYVAVGSGGVWKTENAGTTWTPIFDHEGSYSIGCVTLDPQNPEVVWVGTGENVGGRHVAYGDGVYRSDNGGKSWKNMGLKASEHISKIIVHPTDPHTVWVASQGPLWSKGGERGVYKTTDGGATWQRTLGDAEWVGATDLLIDPRDPNRLYAAAWQRHRTVAGYLGGGPGTALYRSEDGGDTWQKLSKGLPTSNMGKIGLAISPQQPDVVYAAIELDRRTGGIFRSTDRGASWTKMSDEVSGGTGPHYYQELYACPHQFDRLYLVSNYTVTSDDGGKTFRRVNVKNKHVDDHAIAFRLDDPNYMLMGCDGGLYESFDRTNTWKYVGNLPVTQFYKIALDDDLPFYNIYGGTQDNSTQGGPSRTDNRHGIRNSDWQITLGGDGHQPATEPGNPDIVYGQWQQGNLNRFDRRTGENVYIKPQPRPDEPRERFNWDAPILVSPHNPAHLYFASQRVWKSTDRGDSWTALSGDLTTNTERISTPYYGTAQGWDNAWDVNAMSDYSTITSLAVSPVQQGIIYAGTDDGLIQVTEDEGGSWRKIPLDRLPGLPATAFVNDIKADLFDANTVYAVFDNHKFGDYQPYLYKSTDRGRSWSSLRANLPDRTLLWRIVQDFEQPNLLFLGAEYGVYFSPDGGKRWTALEGGLPKIAVRDLAIHRRENDLVLATFGRGIYILDDYSALRQYSAEVEKAEAALFAPRPAYWYNPRTPLGGWSVMQGDDYFMAPNPPFGAEFTFFLKEAYVSRKAQRQKAEKERTAAGQPLSFPGWDALEEEVRQMEPKVWLFVSDAAGKVLRRVAAPNSAGFQRVAWDLSTTTQGLLTKGNQERDPKGPLAAPGTYYAQLYKQLDGVLQPISERVAFEVKPLHEGALPGASPAEVTRYAQEVDALSARIQAFERRMNTLRQQNGLMQAAYLRAPQPADELHRALLALHQELEALDLELNGSKARNEIGEKQARHSLREYFGMANSGSDVLTYGPTATQRACFGYATSMLAAAEQRLQQVAAQTEGLAARLREIGAPEWKVD
jgi:photosystem II stability/assembly factor-like uncharacterized protein